RSAMNTPIREHNLRAAALWGSGDRAYDRISRSISSAIEHCVDRLDPMPGERIADVATGTGLASRAIARLGAQVVGIDIAGPLLNAARDIALEQNLAIECRLSGVPPQTRQRGTNTSGLPWTISATAGAALLSFGLMAYLP